MSMRFLVAAATLAASAFAAAQTVPPPGQDPDASTRKICRVSPANGSRLGGTRVCRTRQEWMDYQREARATTDRIQRVSPPCMMGPNEPGKAHLVCSN